MDTPEEQDKFISQEHSYMPVNPDDIEDKIIEGGECEFIKITCLVDEWIQESFDFFDLILQTFATKFELQSEIE